MATRFQLGTISTEAAPAGVVHAFAGSAAPTGWLLCNGAAVSRAVYAALFGAIASAHGSGDGSTTFNLPDYRGRIIRGRDGGIARDPDRAGRTAAASGGNTGDNVGSVQVEGTKRPATALTSGNESIGHTHAGTTDNGNFISYNNNTPGGTQGVASFVTNTNPISSSSNHVHTFTTGGVSVNHTHTITGGGDSETRPINAYVNYIIKV